MGYEVEFWVEEGRDGTVGRWDATTDLNMTLTGSLELRSYGFSQWWYSELLEDTWEDLAEAAEAEASDRYAEAARDRAKVLAAEFEQRLVDSQ